MEKGAGESELLICNAEVLPLEEQTVGICSLSLSALPTPAALGDVPVLSLSSVLSSGLDDRAKPSLAVLPPKRSSSKVSNSTALSLLLVGVSPERVVGVTLASDRCGVMLPGPNSLICVVDSFVSLQKVSLNSLGLGRLLLSFTMSMLSLEKSDSAKLPLLPPRNGFLSTSSS